MCTYQGHVESTPEQRLAILGGKWIITQVGIQGSIADGAWGRECIGLVDDQNVVDVQRFHVKIIVVLGKVGHFMCCWGRDWNSSFF